MDRNTVNRIYKKLSQKLGSAKSELVYKNHFELLIAVILSAQSTDKTVNSVTQKLFSISPTPESIILLGRKKLQEIIRPVGLSPDKSKNIITTSELLLDKHNGNVPDTREDLENLPGVGRKTANVVLNEAFGKPTIAVDTHVYRVSNRTGLVSEKTTDKTQPKLEKIVPKKWRIFAHHLLILHGRYICKSQKPLCKKCSISSICQFKGKLI